MGVHLGRWERFREEGGWKVRDAFTARTGTFMSVRASFFAPSLRLVALRVRPLFSYDLVFLLFLPLTSCIHLPVARTYTQRIPSQYIHPNLFHIDQSTTRNYNSPPLPGAPHTSPAKVE
jgi:hypothetical protein